MHRRADVLEKMSAAEILGLTCYTTKDAIWNGYQMRRQECLDELGTYLGCMRALRILNRAFNDIWDSTDVHIYDR